MLGQDEEATVGGVDLQPQSVRVCDVCDRVERVDRARVDGPCRSDDEPRVQPGWEVGRDECLKGIRPHPPAIIDLDASDDALSQTSDPQCLLDAVVGFACEVDDGSRHVSWADCGRVARGDDPLEVCHARAGCQVAAGRRRVADEPGHPPHKRPFHPGGGGRRELDARVPITDVRKKIA
jgi:hypothetical protein